MPTTSESLSGFTFVVVRLIEDHVCRLGKHEDAVAGQGALQRDSFRRARRKSTRLPSSI
jgi:hypothetical protein